VAKAIRLLLEAPTQSVVGEAFSCCDAYYSHHDVAVTAKRISSSNTKIVGAQQSPKHQIVTKKIEALGMKFSGIRAFEETITKICHQLMQ